MVNTFTCQHSAPVVNFRRATWKALRHYYFQNSHSPTKIVNIKAVKNLFITVGVLCCTTWQHRSPPSRANDPLNAHAPNTLAPPPFQSITSLKNIPLIFQSLKITTAFTHIFIIFFSVYVVYVFHLHTCLRVFFFIVILWGLIF